MSNDCAEPSTTWQLSRFASVGIIATAVHVGVYVGLIEFGELSAVLASIPSFGAAVLVSYFGNRVWTFGANGRHRTQFPKFAVVATFGLLINVAINLLVVNLARGPYWAALLIVIAVVPLSTYMLNRTWVFRKTSQ